MALSLLCQTWLTLAISTVLWVGSRFVVYQHERDQAILLTGLSQTSAEGTQRIEFESEYLSLDNSTETFHLLCVLASSQHNPKCLAQHSMSMWWPWQGVCNLFQWGQHNTMTFRVEVVTTFKQCIFFICIGRGYHGSMTVYIVYIILLRQCWRRNDNQKTTTKKHFSSFNM